MNHPRRTITINVTQRDIDRGIQRDCDKCPVAISVKRRVRRAACVTAGSYAVVISLPYVSESCFCYMPTNAKRFIRGFDSKKSKAAPFKFPLNIDERFLP